MSPKGSFTDNWDVQEHVRVPNTDTTEVVVQLLIPKRKSRSGEDLDPQLGLAKHIKTERYTGWSGAITLHFEAVPDLVKGILELYDKQGFDAESVLDDIRTAFQGGAT